MRAWSWTLILVVAAVGLAVAARDYAGNIALLIPPYRIEVSLVFAVVFLLVLFASLYALLRALAWTTGLPTRVRAWRQQRVQLQQQTMLEQGWLHLLQGRFARAERDMSQVADQSKVPTRRVLAMLCAAQAAHEMQEYARRDALVVRAREAMGDDPALAAAVAMVEAELMLQENRPADALALVAPLHDGGQRHVHSLRLALRAHRDLQQWGDVLKLSRTLAKRHALQEAFSTDMIAIAAVERLRGAADAAARREVWKELKPAERVLPDVAIAAADGFEADGEPARAREALEAAIQSRPTPALWDAYARTGPDEVKMRLEQGENWLRQTPHDADLLRSLGALCLNGRLWGAGQRYLERSLVERDDPRTHALLAALYDRTGREDDARRHWRQATDAMVGLPHLAAVPPNGAPALIVASPIDITTEITAPDRAAGL